MGLPILWNPVDITVRPLLSAVQDPDYAERSGPDAFGDEIVLPGQPNFWMDRWDQQDRGVGGDQERTLGHILFKIEDLTAYGYQPHKGDAVVKINGFERLAETDFFRINEARPISPFRGSYLFLKCFLTQDVKAKGLFP